MTIYLLFSVTHEGWNDARVETLCGVYSSLEKARGVVEEAEWCDREHVWQTAPDAGAWHAVGIMRAADGRSWGRAHFVLREHTLDTPYDD